MAFVDRNVSSLEAWLKIPLPPLTPPPSLRRALLLQRLLDVICPDRVHIMQAGRIVTSGGMELVDALEAEGYGALGGGGSLSSGSRD